MDDIQVGSKKIEDLRTNIHEVIDVLVEDMERKHGK
jgi:hypothetical protein